MRNRGGFTLLELLMVVIIIAILASIALPQYLKAAERARASEALTMLGSIRSAQQRFQALNNGVFATAAQNCNLDIDVPFSPACPGGPLAAAAAPWLYAVNNGAGNAIATRQNAAAAYTGLVVHIDLAGGASCGGTANAQQVYGVGAPGC